jgi:hypothetical protein
MITKEEYEKMLILISQLMNCENDTEEERELMRLVDLVEEYEEEYYPILETLDNNVDVW